MFMFGKFIVTRNILRLWQWIETLSFFCGGFLLHHFKIYERLGISIKEKLR